MFVRVKSTPNSPRKSVQIVHSIRQGERVKQKILRHVGIAMDEDELVRLQELAVVVMAKLQAQTQASLFPPEQTAQQIIASKRRLERRPLPVDLKQLREEERIVTGIHEVYGSLYEELGLSSVLPAYRYRASHHALFHCVMARLAEPASKRASVRVLEEDLGVRLPLERVYRMMDRLEEKRVGRLKALAVRNAQALFKEPIDVLFFDCTTLYFESFVQDELKQPGYSKDAKFKESQVLLALMVTREGLPVGYEVLPGACFEGHSLLPVVEKIRQTYNLQRTVCVADRGMLNEANLQTLQAAGIDYIVGAKLKRLPKTLQAKILDERGYWETGEGGRVSSFDYGKRRLVVSYSPQRAAKDRHDRQVAVDKLLKKLRKSQNPKNLLNNHGYKKFLKVNGRAKVELDAEKVEQARRWDGLHGVLTNLTDPDEAQILEQYRGLWQVEETFRVTKHDLKIRPIFHWTPARVRAHIAICFMALMCARHLSYRVSLQYRPLSVAVIRNALVHVQHSILKHRQSGKRYGLPSRIGEQARKIYRLMGLTPSTVPYRLD